MRAPRDRRRTLAVAALSAAFAAALAPSSALASPYVNQGVSATTVSVTWVNLTAGTSYVFDTANPTASCDPVLHVLDPSGREVAWDDDSGGNRNARVTYVAPTTGFYRVLVHSYITTSNGRADVRMNGSVISSQATVGGSTLSVPSGAYQYETALAPGGTTDTVLYALNSTRHLVAMSDDEGVGLASRVTGRSDVAYVVVAAYSNAGATNFYVNDSTNDSDGDGLGTNLEHELGTCASTADTGCSRVFNTADSDRDGIVDGAEVFGIDDVSYPQLLPAWGANPRHKDVFVEVDYSNVFASNPVTGADVATAQSYYTAGTTADMLNPDGTPGITLHMDIGIPGPAGTTAYGAWGGSQAVANNDGMAYQSLPNDAANFVTARRGVFHYAFFVSGGGGQGWSPGDRLFWAGSATDRGMSGFVHELGHNLGLGHWGHDSWGQLNCKPNYRSIMNYAYPGAGFSQGTNTTSIDPSNASELSSFSSSPTYLTGEPFWNAISGNSVDWNRDGLFSDSATTGVRAPVTWAPWYGCGSMIYNGQVLPTSSTGLVQATPRLARVGSRLFAFWIGADRNIYYVQGAVTGADSNGSCVGATTVGGTCMTWSPPVVISTGGVAAGVAALGWGSGLALAYSDTSNRLMARYATGVDGAGNLTGWTTAVNVGSSMVEPELAPMYVSSARYGASEVIGLFSQYFGVYGWSSSPGISGAWTARTMTTPSNADVHGNAFAPALAAWPHRGAVTGYASFGTACGLFADNTNHARFYCYDKATDRWSDLSSTMFATIPAPPLAGPRPALVFHEYRDALGRPMGGDATRGSFWMIAAGAVGTPVAYPPSLYMSNAVSRTAPPGSATRAVVVGQAGNPWTFNTSGAGMALFEDANTSALKSVGLFTGAPGTYSAQFFPLADGSVRGAQRDGHDFQVMERGICVGLRGTGFCGTTNTFGY